jgi:hypothetical protein
MTQEQIKAIQESFAKIVSISEQAATLFYARLFEIAPALNRCFRGDMTEQGRKLMVTLGVVVNGLADLESVLPAASALAKRHVNYGVKAADYERVGRGTMDIATRSSLERGLCHAVRLHDYRSLWPQPRRRDERASRHHRRWHGGGEGRCGQPGGCLHSFGRASETCKQPNNDSAITPR